MPPSFCTRVSKTLSSECPQKGHFIVNFKLGEAKVRVNEVSLQNSKLARSIKLGSIIMLLNVFRQVTIVIILLCCAEVYAAAPKVGRSVAVKYFSKNPEEKEKNIR